MNSTRLNTYLSTFHLFLILVGYPLVTTLFLPNMVTYDGTENDVNITRLVTVPYRAFVLALSLTVIVMNWKRCIRVPFAIRLYMIFWCLLTVRIIYDLNVRIDVVVDTSVVQNQYLYTYLVCVIPAFAVFRSTKAIDFALAFKWVVVGYILFVIALAYNSPDIFSTQNTGERLAGNIALNPISLGQCGAVLAVLGLYCMAKKIKWLQLCGLAMTLTGGFIILRSGSRGPLTAFFASLLFYVVSVQKNPLWVTLLLTLSGLFFTLFEKKNFEVIRLFSPVMATRLSPSGNVTQFEELSTGRSDLFGAAIDKFLNHPLFGDSYVMFSPNGSIEYSHNMVLDAFMGLGLFGGILFVTVISYAIWSSFKMIREYHPHSWLGLLCFCYIIRHMFSFTFYQADVLNALLLIIFQLNVNAKRPFMKKSQIKKSE